MIRGACIVAWREFKTLVTSPIFLVVSTVCTVFWSFVYLRALSEFAGNMQMMQMTGQESGMNIFYHLFFPHISIIHLVLVFAVPLLTMRLISEEKKMRTFDLLLTSPITSVDIAVGKFLAGFGVALVLALISFLYPLMTAMIADFNWGTLLSAYLGLVLVLGVYVAVGLFASSMTESAFLAAILALMMNLALWFIGQSSDSAESATTFSILNQMSLGINFSAFLKGSLKISSTVFFVSLIAFFVFLAERVVESSRWRA